MEGGCNLTIINCYDSPICVIRSPFLPPTQARYLQGCIGETPIRRDPFAIMAIPAYSGWTKSHWASSIPTAAWILSSSGSGLCLGSAHSQDKATHTGATATYIAAYRGHLGVLQRLVAAGADKDSGLQWDLSFFVSLVSFGLLLWLLL